MWSLSLLSLLPPSYMVVPNRETANINYFFTTSVMINPVKANCISEDINMEKSRDKSTFPSMNTSRVLSTLSKILSTPYINQIEA